jgi:hypothetical protein
MDAIFVSPRAATIARGLAITGRAGEAVVVEATLAIAERMPIL